MLNIHTLYLILSAALIVLTLVSSNRFAKRQNQSFFDSILRPSQISIMYTCVFYFFGALFFSTGTILSTSMVVSASNWTIAPVLIWFIGTVSVILVVNRVPSGIIRPEYNMRSRAFDIVAPIFGILFSLIYGFTEIFPFWLFAIAMFFMAFGNFRKPSIFLLLSSLTLIYLSIGQASVSKRNFIFPAAIIVALLLQNGVISKKIAAVIGAIVISLIVPMSIYRGYGAYNVDSFSDAIYYSWDYIRNPLFLRYFANNMEFSSFYFHGVNAVEIFWASGNYAYGGPIVRSAISPLIYFGLVDGLDSSIDIYTNLYDPSFRAMGGSLPVDVFATLFLNFGVFTIFAYPVLSVILDKVYFRLLRIRVGVIRFGMLGGFMFANLLLFRGAGFSLFFYNFLLASVPVVIIWLLLTERRPDDTKKRA